MVNVLDPFFVSRPSAIMERICSGSSAARSGDISRSRSKNRCWAAPGRGARHLARLFARAVAFLARVFDPYIKMLNACRASSWRRCFCCGSGSASGRSRALGHARFFVMFQHVQGVRDADRVLIDNVRMLGATERQLVRHVLIRARLTWIFSSLQTSLGFAMVGAVVESISARRAVSGT